MERNINLAVFASTSGTDLQAVIDAINSGQLAGVDLKFVLSNKEDCFALERARRAGLAAIFINPNNSEKNLLKRREVFDAECLKVCLEHRIDLIIFIGYMRLVSKVLIKPYKNRIMNIHPSLLPKYPGMDLDVHREVLFNKEKETGCTLHFVTEQLDAGPIILQEKVAIAEDETPSSLKEKVQAQEKFMIIKGIELFRDGRLL